MKSVKDSDNLEDIKKKTEDLTQAFYSVSEKIYKDNANKGQAENPQGQKSDDDVVDADYEVVDDEEDSNK